MNDQYSENETEEEEVTRYYGWRPFDEEAVEPDDEMDESEMKQSGAIFSSMDWKANPNATATMPDGTRWMRSWDQGVWFRMN